MDDNRGVTYELMRESVPGFSLRLEMSEFVFLRELGFTGLVGCGMEWFACMGPLMLVREGEARARAHYEAGARYGF